MEVISIEFIGYELIVYDLETESGDFVAGGIDNGILVKNTDSCFLMFPVDRKLYDSEGSFMTEVFRLGYECAEYCTNHFPPPIKLEMEKVLCPSIIYAKKRYAYVHWSEPSGPEIGIQYKGLQLVRRDTCGYVKKMLNGSMNIIMKQTNIKDATEKAIPFVRQSVTDLLNGDVDIEDLVLSNQLKGHYKLRINKKTESVHWTDPRIKRPHVRLAQNLMKKDPTNHPKPPDRVPFIYIDKEGDRRKILQCDKVVHPSNYVKGSVDSLYYFDHQYKKPIDTIFQFMVTDKHGAPNTEKIYEDLRQIKVNQLDCQPEISMFFKPKPKKETFVFKCEDDTEDGGDGEGGDGGGNGGDSDDEDKKKAKELDFHLTDDMFEDFED